MNPLAEISSPRCSTDSDRLVFFQHLFRRVAVYRNTVRLYSEAESSQTTSFSNEIDTWANNLLKCAWAACEEPGEGGCPILDRHSDTSLRGLLPLPPQERVSMLLNTTLLLHMTSFNGYSARTRALLFSLGKVNEKRIVSTLKNPDQVLEEAQRFGRVEHAKEQEADSGKPWRAVGTSLGAVAGGILIGITGGLAAPIVGASVSTLLGMFGLGGTLAGLLATGLASSSVICGALFGAYGAQKTATIMERHTREVKDLAIIPVHPSQDTLAVRVCVSGWLNTKDDVTNPWTIFDQSEDTFALRWEVEALENLSTALITLLKAQAMKYVKAEIIKRTFLAGLMAALSPLAWLQIGKIIDNPWMIARQLAVKAGRVLGILLASRVFGARPVTLTGYSLGSLVIFEALKYISTLPVSETLHLIDDVFLFGTPVASEDLEAWRAVRRVVSGRLVNGYVDSSEDYVLAVLSRATSAASGWGVAGLEPVAVQGVENIKCSGVEGHLQWIGKVGTALETCEAKGIVHQEVEKQLRDVADPIEEVLKSDGMILPTGPG